MTELRRGDVEIAAVGSVLADPARCRMLLALDDGRALPASVLADEAGVSRSTASSSGAACSTSSSTGRGCAAATPTSLYRAALAHAAGLVAAVADTGAWTALASADDLPYGELAEVVEGAGGR